jgi:prepilin-type N-terminal cleavage/methylation domain-containing protein
MAGFLRSKDDTRTQDNVLGAITTKAFSKPHKSSQGFTIVELLIVIVVIGVLAAIIIVTYSGITQRALNTNRIAGAQDAITALRLYATQNNSYPPVAPGIGTACIAGWDAGGQCHFTGGFTADRYSPFETAYKTVSSNLPRFPEQSTDGFNGLTFIANPSFTVDGQPSYYLLVYVLQGDNEDCKISGLVKFSTGSALVSTTRNSLSIGDGVTGCDIALPMPE